MNWSYERAGVSIDKGDAWVDVIKSIVAKRTGLPKAAPIGGFSGLWPLGGGKFLAACCDGVGTKLEVAKKCGIYRGLGQDLVGMNVNDLITCGATPLFFLDYMACGKLDEGVLSEVIEGVLDGCEAARCALLGGETAEMPGVYPADGFDLAGFAVGIVDEADIVDGSAIAEGDVIIGLPSSGVHSNGFSLVRKALIEDGLKLPLDTSPEGFASGETLAEALMRPTRIYVAQALSAMKVARPKGMAHITGGGLESNIRRIVPGGLDVRIDFDSWKRPAIFGLISAAGVDEDEMRRVFNLGVGFAIVTAPGDAEKVCAALRELGEEPGVIGGIV